MIEAIYGTQNPAKLEAMQRSLESLNIRVIGLKEGVKKYHASLPEIVEDGETPLENAKKKALAYFEVFPSNVFSCDSALYLENVPKEEQPGIFVRRVKGKVLTDEEMVEYYTGLARKYHNPVARYQNAVCLVKKEGTVYESMDESLWGESFLLASEARPVRRKGFPIDSISIDIKTGKYYYDLPDFDGLGHDTAVGEGFLNFFKKYLISVQAG